MNTLVFFMLVTLVFRLFCKDFYCEVQSHALKGTFCKKTNKKKNPLTPLCTLKAVHTLKNVELSFYGKINFSI